MKKLFTLFTLVLISSVILFTGCKKKDDSTPLPSATELISRAWVPSTPVQFEGAPDTRFENFEVTFTQAGAYSSVNGYPVFRSSGAWAFENDNTSKVLLDGSHIFTITTLNETSLQGNITLTGGANARTTGIDGTYTFNLVPKQ